MNRKQQPNYFRQLTTGQVTLLNIFCLAMFTIIITFPKQLLPRYALWLVGFGFMLLSLNFHFEWLEFLGHKFIFPYLFVYAFGVWAFYRQWKNARKEPLDRAAILALQLSAMIPCGLIVILVAIPQVIGSESFIGLVSTRLLLIVIFIGWGIGILRYRLFDVEYWWLKSLFWVLGGSLVFLVDLVAITLFQMSEQYALGLSVITAGFLYFPMRQWVLQKILPDENRSLPEFLPLFSSQMAGAKTQQEFEQYWSNALQQRFQPLHLAPINDSLSAPAIVENGMVLQVPDLQGSQSYRLHGKQGAARLFNTADVKNSESLLTVARMASNASNARQQAILEERQRIMHDLHDTVGAELMTLTHKLQQPEDKKATRRTLSILRDTVRLSLKSTPLYLKEQLVEWRAEIASRLEVANTKLDWQEPNNDAQLTPREVLELTQILRELVSNALKHARPDILLLRFELSEKELQITLSHDGDVSDPSQWKPGTGLDSLQKRCASLQGNIISQLESTEAKKRLKTYLTFPLLT